MSGFQPETNREGGRKTPAAEQHSRALENRRFAGPTHRLKGNELRGVAPPTPSASLLDASAGAARHTGERLGSPPIPTRPPPDGGPDDPFGS